MSIRGKNELNKDARCVNFGISEWGSYNFEGRGDVVFGVIWFSGRYTLLRMLNEHKEFHHPFIFEAIERAYFGSLESWNM